jgi:large subunit ribosomal protein L21
MYAVLKTGGKQYKVAENDVIIVEKLVAEAGSTIDLDEVLMIGDGETSKVGTPNLDGAKVTAEVLEQKRGKKVIVFKKKRRQNYRRTRGHRQELTVLRITDILADGKKKASRAKAKAQAKTEETAVEAAAPEAAPEATENKE